MLAVLLFMTYALGCNNGTVLVSGGVCYWPLYSWAHFCRRNACEKIDLMKKKRIGKGTMLLKRD